MRHFNNNNIVKKPNNINKYFNMLKIWPSNFDLESRVVPHLSSSGGTLAMAADSGTARAVIGCRTAAARSMLFGLIFSRCNTFPDGLVSTAAAAACPWVFSAGRCRLSNRRPFTEGGCEFSGLEASTFVGAL